MAGSGLDIDRLENVKRLGDGSIRAACPACRAADSDTSGDHLLIQPDGKYGCAAHAADREHRAAIFKLASKIPNGASLNGNALPSRIVETYSYLDASGKLLFQVVRYAPKTFKQRRPDPHALDGWIWNLKNVRRVPYRLPELIAAVSQGRPIFICEGEKDCDALVKAGFAATCNNGGAGKWDPKFADYFKGAEVCVIADRDEPGLQHAQSVAASLHPFAASIRVIELPGDNVKDSADFFNAGGQAPELDEIAQAAPLWTPGIKIEVTQPNEPAEIRGEIVRILLDGKLSQNEQRTQIANAVVLALCERGQFFYHAELKDFDSAMFFDGQRKELLRIRSDAFQAWLADWLAVNKADAVFKYIIAQVETTALAGKQTKGILPESFWAARPGAIYLSNGNGRITKITPGNVQLLDNGTDAVLFGAGNTLAEWELTAPENPFETCALFREANCAATHGPDLLRLFVFSLPTNPASKPPLCLAGDIGAGKTRLAKGIAEFYGLPFTANKVEDFGEDSFWASLDAGGLFTLDNCDTRNKWLPDAVASAATDGCSQRRKLYTDAERVTLRARAWLALTTANPTFASDSGLADRLLLVRMNRRTDETSDAGLSDEIRAHRNSGLSFIARTLATALADTQKTPPGLNQRHPDFAAFAVRIGRATGREPETVHALRTAEHDKSLFCLENDGVATALLSFLANGETFTGPASELRAKLIEQDAELADKLSVKRLGKRLSALMPHLQKVLQTAKQEIGRGRLITYTLKSRPCGECGEFQTRF